MLGARMRICEFLSCAIAFDFERRAVSCGESCEWYGRECSATGVSESDDSTSLFMMKYLTSMMKLDHTHIGPLCHQALVPQFHRGPTGTSQKSQQVGFCMSTETSTMGLKASIRAWRELKPRSTRDWTDWKPCCESCWKETNQIGCRKGLNRQSRAMRQRLDRISDAHCRQRPTR